MITTISIALGIIILLKFIPAAKTRISPLDQKNKVSTVIK